MNHIFPDNTSTKFDTYKTNAINFAVVAKAQFSPEKLIGFFDKPQIFDFQRNWYLSEKNVHFITSNMKAGFSRPHFVKLKC